MVSYWVCVTNKENWEIVKREKTWGVSRKNQKLLEKTEIGDFLVFYVKTNKLGGIFKIISKPFESEEEIFGSAGLVQSKIYPYRVKLDPMIIPKEPIPFEGLIPRLGFIVNKEQWGSYLRKAMIRVRRESYEVMRQSLKRELEGN